jgi:Leucine-rich repeat (LRR) protein
VGLTNLTSLDLRRSGLRSLIGIETMRSLRTLDASENRIRDVTPLRGMTGLQTLELGANQIRDVTPLAELASLRTLAIEANEIQDITPLTPPRLRFLAAVSVEENCLDMSPGADDRAVVDEWLRRGVEVEPEFLLQHDCSAAALLLGIALAGDSLEFQWRTSPGAEHRIQESTDLKAWREAGLPTVVGDGQVVAQQLAPRPESPRYFRLEVTGLR